VTIVNKSSGSRAGSRVAVVLALALAALGVALGVWQLNRADEKEHLTELRQTRTDWAVLGRPSPLSGQAGKSLAWQSGLQPSDLDQQRVLLDGEWLHDRTIALDNRAWEGRPGVHVLTPLRLPDASIVWVNRGWMPKPPGMGPAPEMPRAERPEKIEGVALASVMRRVELSSSPDQLRQGRLWQNFDWDAAQDWIPGKVWPVIVWQTSDNGDGLLRRVPEVKDDVPKHLGYALQWFLLTALALFFAWRLRPQ